MHNESQDLKSVLLAVLKQNGMENVVREASLPTFWNEIVGDAAAKHCSDLRFSQGELKMSVDSSVWRSEFKMRHDDLVKKLNQRAGADIVQRVVFNARAAKNSTN